ncbi:MAG: hypothetical protein V4629_09460 [Pseudomonadota bacterium]
MLKPITSSVVITTVIHNSDITTLDKILYIHFIPNAMRCAVCLEEYESRLHAILPCKDSICSFCIQSTLNAQDIRDVCPVCVQPWNNEFKRDYFKPQQNFFIWSRECLQRCQEGEYWQEGILALHVTLKTYIDQQSNIYAQQSIYLQIKQFFLWLSDQLPDSFFESAEQKGLFLNSIFSNFENIHVEKTSFEKISVGLNFFLKLGEIQFHPGLHNSNDLWNLSKNYNTAIRLIYQLYQNLNNLNNILENPSEIDFLKTSFDRIKIWTQNIYIEFIKTNTQENSILNNEAINLKNLVMQALENENLPNDLLIKYVCLPFEWIQSYAYSDYLTFVQSDSAILELESIWFPHQLAIKFDTIQEPYWLHKISNIKNETIQVLHNKFDRINEYVDELGVQNGIVEWMKSLILCKNIKNIIFLNHILKLLESLKFLSDIEQFCRESYENNYHQSKKLQ